MPAPTRVTKELLDYWFNNFERHAVKKLFFAQREAVETAIWLKEIAEKTGVGKSILARLQLANAVSSDKHEFNLQELHLKWQPVLVKLLLWP